jgi:spheroidene monooxygenase
MTSGPTTIVERVADGLASAAAPATSVAAPQSAPAVARATRIVVLQLFALGAGHRAWGFGALALGRYRWRHVPGLVFWKSLGSGFEGGFGLRPSGSRQGLFCVFEDEAFADRFLASSSFLAAYRARSTEHVSVKLRPFASRGSWSGVPLAPVAEAPTHGPIASLTRASIRPAAALRFWRKAPPAERSLAAAPGCLLAVGLGEAPLLRQATFTIWESAAAMDAYARSGAHLEAIRAAYRERHFAESMFVRLVPSELRGTWMGRRVG